MTFDAFTGPLARFGAISVQGNAQVTDGVIRRMLGFNQNGLYRAEQVLEARRNLYGLEIFSAVDVSEQSLTPTDSIVPMLVTVWGLRLSLHILWRNDSIGACER